MAWKFNPFTAKLDYTEASTGVGSGDMTKAVYDPTNKNGDAFARANHTGTQEISTVTGLQTALDGKAPTSHTHSISDVTNLQTELDGKQDQSNILDLLATLDLTGNASKVVAANATEDGFELVTPAAGGGGFGPFLLEPPVNGYLPIAPMGNSTNSIAGANYFGATVFVPQFSFYASQIAVQVSTAGTSGSQIKFAVYEVVDGTYENAVLLQETTGITTTSIGTKSRSFSPELAFEAGKTYLICYKNTTNSAQFRCWAASAWWGVSNESPANSQTNRISYASLSTTYADAFPTNPPSATLNSSTHLAIWLRVGSY